MASLRKKIVCASTRVAHLHVVTWIGLLVMASALAYANLHRFPPFAIPYTSAYAISEIKAAYGWPFDYRFDKKTTWRSPGSPNQPPKTQTGAVYFPVNAVYNSLVAIVLLLTTGICTEGLVRHTRNRLQFSLRRLFVVIAAAALCLGAYRSRYVLESALGAPLIWDLLHLPLPVRVPLLSGLALAVYLTLSFSMPVFAACFRLITGVLAPRK